MKTKIIYVVISDETDIYLEQALLSVFSLRKHNPNAYVELVVDQDTDATIAGKRGEILKYIDNKIVVNVPEEYNKVCRSRWLKTSLRQHVNGDFLFLDTDTIVTEDLEEIDCFTGDLGAVKDQHVNAGQNTWKSRLLKKAKQEGWTFNDNIPYYNSGVMYVRDSAFANDFYRLWHQKWLMSYDCFSRPYDQSPLAATNESFQYPIKELSGEWNCQPISGIGYLYKAKVIHYWKIDGTTWMITAKGILFEVKEKGRVPKSVAEMINNAKGAFLTPNRIIAGKDMEIYSSPVYQICKSNKTVFTFFNHISNFLFDLSAKKRKFIRLFRPV